MLILPLPLTLPLPAGPDCILGPGKGTSIARYLLEGISGLCDTWEKSEWNSQRRRTLTYILLSSFRPQFALQLVSMKFNKTVVNFWLDTFLLLVFLLLCWCGVILRYVFPPVTKIEGWTLWGGSFGFWSDVEFATLCILSAGIMLHVMLHWSWVCGVVGKWQRNRKGAKPGPSEDTGSRTLWGVGLLILICNVIGLGIAAAVLTIQAPTL